MTPEPARRPEQRKADTLAKLQAVGADVWVATAAAPTPGAAAPGEPADAPGADAPGADASAVPGSGGWAGPYLVPLSLAWVDGLVVLATVADSPTVRNLRATGSARLGLGPTRDVVMIDAVLDSVTPVDAAPAGLLGRFAEQSGWDARTAGPGYVLVCLRPHRVQAWREENELPGRTLMRDGVWVV